MAQGKPQPSLGCAYVLCALLVTSGALLMFGAQRHFNDGGKMAETVVFGIFGALSLGAGFWLLGPMRRWAQRAADDRHERETHPQAPWRWKAEWRGQAIAADTHGGAAVMWFFAVLWNALSWPAAWGVATKGDAPAWVAFVYVFPVIGLWLLGLAIYKSAQAKKYGRPQFVPATMPGNLGGYLGGVVEVPARVTPEADPALRLRCVRRVTTGSGKNRSTRESVLWEREERIPREKWVSAAGRTEIPVLFHVPADCAATSFENPNNEIVWRLQIEAASPGVDFAAQFVVPVFATGDTAPPPERGAPALEQYRGVSLDEAALRSSGIERGPGIWHFRTTHLGGARVVFTLVAIGFVALSGWLAWNGAHLGAQAGVWLFTVIFVALAFSLWSRGYTLALAGSDVVVTKHAWFGSRETRVPRADVARVTAKKSMSTGDTEYYRLLLWGRDGVDARTPAAGEHFDARKLRYRLARRAKELGVSDVDQLGGAGAELMAEMNRTPRFRVVFAESVRGLANAEAIGAAVLAEINGR